MIGLENNWENRRPSTEKLILSNCGAGKDPLEFLGQQGDQTSQSERKSTLNTYWRTDAEAEAPILWPPDVKSRLTAKDADAGKDWRQKEKRVTEDEKVEWHHWFNGHELVNLQEIVRESWHAAVHGITKSWTLHFHWLGLILVGELRFCKLRGIAKKKKKRRRRRSYNWRKMALYCRGKNIIVLLQEEGPLLGP